MADTSNNAEFSHPFVVAKLSEAFETPFALSASEAQAKAVANQLDIISVRKLRFAGTIVADDNDWILEGVLGASATQACVVTLESVRTRIDIDVYRRFTKSIPEESQKETLIPNDDDIEVLGAVIDPAIVAMEALALALPEYPRVDGAELDDGNFGPPGAAPLTDEAARPFAGLEALKKKLEDDT